MKYLKSCLVLLFLLGASAAWGAPDRGQELFFADELAALPALGVDLAAVTEKLLADGLASFTQSFRDMMGIIAAKRAALA